MERREGPDERYVTRRRGVHLATPDEGDVVGSRLIAGLDERKSPAFRETCAAIGAEIALVGMAKRLIRAREMLGAPIEHMGVVWREELKHPRSPPVMSRASTADAIRKSRSIDQDLNDRVTRSGSDLVFQHLS